jgi:glycosyltransferase involved in cell wall biosynthesis
MNAEHAKMPISGGDRISLTHLITSTSTGGAETMLLKLVSRIDRDRFRTSVISLTDIGDIGGKLLDIGIQVTKVGAARGSLNPLALFRLAGILRSSKTDILQTWMYHSDLAGGLAARMSGSIPVVWNIRHSNLDRSIVGKTTMITAKACAYLSRFLPRKIACCSRESMSIHSRLGYDSGRMVVIPNGFDTEIFRPDPEARALIRDELKIDGNSPLVGLVARYHPQKDHATFIRAAGIIHRSRPNLHFLLCGEGITRDNDELASLIAGAGIGDAVHLLGPRGDIPAIQASLDIASSSSSSGEGFPNIIGEAMSCGVPCVVTDVGDSAEIVGDSGFTVAPSDERGLATAWERILSMKPGERSDISLRARRRIQDNYGIDEITKRYEKLYIDILSNRHQPVN